VNQQDFNKAMKTNIKVIILIITSLLMACGNSGPSKNTARHLSKSDFSQFGSDPWVGILPITKGDFIALDINVTTQGTENVVYTEYEFYYTAVNCWGNTQRRTFVSFSDYGLDKFRKYVGQSVTLYGVVKEIRIKRPKHACDEANVFVTLSNVEVESH
jgi:hypothetical protein